MPRPFLLASQKAVPGIRILVIPRSKAEENAASYAAGEISGYWKQMAKERCRYILRDTVEQHRDQTLCLWRTGAYAAVTQNPHRLAPMQKYLQRFNMEFFCSRSTSQKALENGTLDDLTSVARVNQNDSNAITFGKILLYADYSTWSTIRLQQATSVSMSMLKLARIRATLPAPLWVS